jgi:hypothetical protein
VGSGRGVEYYYSTYTHHQLWKMSISHSNWQGVEDSRLFWRQARQELEINAAALRRYLEALEAYWTGREATAFQDDVRYVVWYNEAIIEDMEHMETSVLPRIGHLLRDFHERAQAAGLNPLHWDDRDEWIEDHADGLRRLNERSKFDAYEGFRDEQHLMIAEAVAWLGDRYQELIAASDLHASSIDVNRLPGADTYELPRGGVYGMPAQVPALEDGLPAQGGQSAPTSESAEDADDDGVMDEFWTFMSDEEPDVKLAGVHRRGRGLQARGKDGSPEDGKDREVAESSKGPRDEATKLGRKLAREKAKDGLPGAATAETSPLPHRPPEDERQFFDVGEFEES